MGAGIIGKRLAAALSAPAGEQDTYAPRLAGIALRGPNIFATARPELPVFAADARAAERLREVGTEPKGDLDQLLASADIVVDCGPSRTGAGRSEVYAAHGVRAVFCGGERDARLGPLIHSALNPQVAARPGGLRVLSCNTTALARVLAGIGPDDVRTLDATILRCSTDTDKATKGITNGAVLARDPSHHAADLRAVAPGPTVRTAAATVPMTAGHFLHVRLTLRAGLGAAEGLDRLRRAERVDVLAGEEPVHTAQLKERSEAPWHDRYDVQIVPIGQPGKDRLEFWLSLDNQAITIPETLDAIQLAAPGGTARQARLTSDRMLRTRSTAHHSLHPTSDGGPR
ncbi:hypothetical protein AVL59_12505 [Streptomyces griseochromogenes]|uniref:Glyceraldehyde-3-phosphate dehydrogenase n=1 Tax=Streptomyces griseochromogenes TaxID=68214 RepID=A0A1B1AUT1_9ACTN|nr:hypothetical protein AVL59_12505 [Streptomyces griseochromogenes]